MTFYLVKKENMIMAVKTASFNFFNESNTMVLFGTEIQQQDLENIEEKIKEDSDLSILSIKNGDVVFFEVPEMIVDSTISTYLLKYESLLKIGYVKALETLHIKSLASLQNIKMELSRCRDSFNKPEDEPAEICGVDKCGKGRGLVIDIESVHSNFLTSLSTVSSVISMVNKTFEGDPLFEKINSLISNPAEMVLIKKSVNVLAQLGRSFQSFQEMRIQVQAMFIKILAQFLNTSPFSIMTAVAFFIDFKIQVRVYQNAWKKLLKNLCKIKSIDCKASCSAAFIGSISGECGKSIETLKKGDAQYFKQCRCATEAELGPNAIPPRLLTQLDTCLTAYKNNPEFKKSFYNFPQYLDVTVKPKIKCSVDKIYSTITDCLFYNIQFVSAGPLKDLDVLELISNPPDNLSVKQAAAVAVMLLCPIFTVVFVIATFIVPIIQIILLAAKIFVLEYIKLALEIIVNSVVFILEFTFFIWLKLLLLAPAFICLIPGIGGDFCDFVKSVVNRGIVKSILCPIFENFGIVESGCGSDSILDQFKPITFKKELFPESDYQIVLEAVNDAMYTLAHKLYEFSADAQRFVSRSSHRFLNPDIHVINITPMIGD